jgi:phosphoribosylglycinamide formyltransferase-1
VTLRIAVLLSGSGSTLEHLIDERAKGRLDVSIEAVLSSKPDAFALERARRHGIPGFAVDRRAHALETSFQDALHRILDEVRPDLLVLAGFLSRLELRGRYEGRAMNVHPALIPAFCGKGYYGMRVQRAVLEYGVKVTGATVHFCDEEYDTGPIILQKAVSVLEGDTPETLASRVQEAEREIYPRAIRLFAERRLRIEGRRVHILPPNGAEYSA